MQLFSTLFFISLLSASALAPTLAQSQTPTLRLGNPNVLTTDSTPLTVEIPIQQGSTSYARVRLAPSPVYSQRGVEYPAWLSDAIISIKTRAGQYRTLLIEAKRGNPDVATELLLEFGLGDVQWIQSYTLMLDHISTFSGTPPVVPSAAESGPNIGEWIQRANKPAAQPPTAPVFATDVAISSEPKQRSTVKARPTKRMVPKSTVAPAPQMTASAPDAPLSQPLAPPTVVASEPALPTAGASAPLAMPSPQSNPIPMPPSTNKKQAWWSDWTVVGAGVAFMLLIAGLIYRVWRRKQVSGAAKVQERVQQSGFAVTQGQGQAQANTVFGLSPQEANTMHEQWLNQKLAPK